MNELEEVLRELAEHYATKYEQVLCDTPEMVERYGANSLGDVVLVEVPPRYKAWH